MSANNVVSDCIHADNHDKNDDYNFAADNNDNTKITTTQAQQQWQHL